MTVAQEYYDLTLRPVTPKIEAWLSRLVERFGDVGVSRALEWEAERGEFHGLLGRVQDRLVASEKLASTSPTFVDRDWLLAIAKGESDWPAMPYAWSMSTLTREEWEVVAPALGMTLKP